MSTPRLKDKTAIITGATGGIGEATAKMFLQEGANVMLVGRSEEKLRATRDRLAAGKRVAISVADAADEKATAAAVAATVQTFGGVDILFANAGMEGTVKNIEDVAMQDFEQLLRTNVLGVWLGMKHCVAPMKKRGGGSMITVGSIASVVGFPGLGPYIASKHAVYGLTKTAAMELGGLRIRVNAIGPGPIDNRMTQSLGNQMSPDDPKGFRDQFSNTIAMKRYGTNEEVASLALFLASDESSYCNGGIFMIDGGFAAA
jgi:NAD(P)-dependent dehydrogenase (short-subunit alcohol dehydrogenase family)